MFPLFADLQFDHPARLLGLAVLPVIGYLAYASSTSDGLLRRGLSLLCRCGLCVAIVLALAGLAEHSASSQKLLIVARDVSRSADTAAADSLLKELREQQGGHRLAFLDFAGQVAKLTDQPNDSDQWETLQRLASNPAAAIPPSLRYRRLNSRKFLLSTMRLTSKALAL